MDCRVTGFRPNVTLEWTSLGIVKPPLGPPFQRTLPNGTAEREVTISVTAKLDEVQNYTCTVRGEATNRTDWSTTVSVLVPPVPTGMLELLEMYLKGITSRRNICVKCGNSGSKLIMKVQAYNVSQ